VIRRGSSRVYVNYGGVTRWVRQGEVVTERWRRNKGRRRSSNWEGDAWDELYRSVGMGAGVCGLEETVRVCVECNRLYGVFKEEKANIKV